MSTTPRRPPALLPKVDTVTLIGWSLMTAALLLVLWLHLLSALFGGLTVYTLVQALSRLLRFSSLRRQRAKVLALALVAALVIAGLSAAGAGLFGFLRHGTYSLPDLFQRLADLIENSRNTLPVWVTSHLPTDAETLRSTVVQWLREHTAAVSGAGRDVGRGIVHTLMGMIVGGLLTLRENAPAGAWAQLGNEHGARLALAFRRIVFAQFWISAFNTLLTWLFLGVVLPLAGHPLPLTKTLVLLTFVAGLLPILGNLISNTVIVLVSLSQSIWLAGAALLYLISIHKLEYFLNARIVGGHIRARAWELLTAMLVMEAAFGISGLIAAPVYYAWVSAELRDRGLA